MPNDVVILSWKHIPKYYIHEITQMLGSGSAMLQYRRAV